MAEGSHRSLAKRAGKADSSLASADSGGARRSAGRRAAMRLRSRRSQKPSGGRVTSSTTSDSRLWATGAAQPFQASMSALSPGSSRPISRARSSSETSMRWSGRSSW